MDNPFLDRESILSHKPPEIRNTTATVGGLTGGDPPKLFDQGPKLEFQPNVSSPAPSFSVQSPVKNDEKVISINPENTELPPSPSLRSIDVSPLQPISIPQIETSNLEPQRFKGIEVELTNIQTKPLTITNINENINLKGETPQGINVSTPEDKTLDTKISPELEIHQTDLPTITSDTQISQTQLPNLEPIAPPSPLQGTLSTPLEFNDVSHPSVGTDRTFKTGQEIQPEIRTTQGRFDFNVTTPSLDMKRFPEAAGFQRRGGPQVETFRIEQKEAQQEKPDVFEIPKSAEKRGATGGAEHPSGIILPNNENQPQKVAGGLQNVVKVLPGTSIEIRKVSDDFFVAKVR